MSKTKNQGEGDIDAARRYDQAQKAFVDSGRVEDAARKAAPRTSEEAAQMQAAEKAGRDRAKDEDPTVPGANAKPH